MVDQIDNRSKNQPAGNVGSPDEASPTKQNWLTAHPNFISLATLLIAVGSILISYGKFSEKIDSYGNDILNIQKSISEINNEIKSVSNGVSSLTAKSDALEKNIDMLNQAVFCYRPTTTFASAITETYGEIGTITIAGTDSMTSATKIAYSKNIQGQEYTAEQLADQAILLPYTENGKEVYFYGQVDERGRWDGRCIVNIYKNNKLLLITDAQYDGGKLLNFQQVFPNDKPLSNGDNIWSISNRTMKDGFSEGETWRYFRDRDYKKDFTTDSATASDILDVDTFKMENAGAVEGYYSGNISDGSYNDNTGNAYYVQFFDDGTVDTLYVGRFEKGNFQDTTGTAWMIGNDGEGTPYCYYQGPFNNGNPINEWKYWEQPLTVERIQKIISSSGVEFKCNLKWANDAV